MTILCHAISAGLATLAIAALTIRGGTREVT